MNKEPARQTAEAASNQPDNLLALFAPCSVAVVGASRQRTKLGYLVLRNVKTSGFPGPIYPVNPAARRIAGLRAYPSVSDIPGPVDLAIVAVPAPAVLPVVEDCAGHGVRAAIVITAGFRETGRAGAEAERKLVEVARSTGMRLLGPNCLGLIDTVTPLNASFAARMPAPNGIAFMSQSGALGTAILDWAAARELGFSKFVSLGNEADVTESDLLDVWKNDETVRVIAAYLEGISDGGRFRRVATAVTRRRPVVVVKAGRTASGSRAVTSHTGALAGSDSAYSAAFRQCGVVRADTLEELFDAASAFSSQPLPTGRRLTIVTNAGGPGIIATDASVAAGMTLARLTVATTRQLRATLPPAASVANPIDVLGDASPDRYHAAIDAALADSNGDALLVILTPQLTTDAVGTARVAVEARGRTDRPILACFMGSLGVKRGVVALNEGRIPNYPFPERAVTALGALVSHAEWLKRPTGEPRRFAVDRPAVAEVLRRAHEEIEAVSTPPSHLPESPLSIGDGEGQGVRQLPAMQTTQLQLDSLHAARILDAYGIPTPRGALTRSPDEAARAAEQIGLPVVLKVVSPDIPHKSDVGGVRVGLTTTEDVRGAYREICSAVAENRPSARIEGIAVWEMAPPGIETIVGTGVDPTFGHLLLFGLGGIYVEILKDVSLRVVPVMPTDATTMIQEIRTYPLLAGARGRPPADVAAIADVLERVSQLATDFPEIRELDLNPLIVYPTGKGVVAVDARLTLSV